MARVKLTAAAGLATNAVAALSPQVAALLLLAPSEFAVFSLLFVALGLVQSAQNSLVVDPWLRYDRGHGALPMSPVLWSSAGLAAIAACIPVVLDFVNPAEFWLAALGLLLAQARNSLRLMAVALSWRAVLLSDAFFILGFAAMFVLPQDDLTWSRLWTGVVVGSALGLAPWLTALKRSGLVPWAWFRDRSRAIRTLWAESTILDLGVAVPPIAFAKLMPPTEFAVIRATTSALLPVRLILLPLRAQIVGRHPRSLRSGPIFRTLVAFSCLVGALTGAGLLLVGSWSLAGQGVLPLLREYALEVALMSALQLIATTLYLACRVHCPPRQLLLTRFADTTQQIFVLVAGFVMAGLPGAVWGYAAFSAVSVGLWWWALGNTADGSRDPGDAQSA